jgi:protein O-mannosyl-transferase
MVRPRLIVLLLALITLLAYLPVAHHNFLNYDDDDYVTNNPVVQNGLTLSGIQWAFTTGHASNWHPITWLSHMLDYELFGSNAGAQHCVNVLFHAINAVLLLLLLFRMTSALWPSAFVAALFAWHPLHVESVAWIAERKDVLSTFFEMLALLAYTQFVAESKARSPRSKVFYALALLMFALGLMSKPMLVTLPFLLMLLDYWPLQRFPLSAFRFPLFLRLALEKWPFFLLAAASCTVTFLVQRSQAVLSLQQYPLNLRLEKIPLSYVQYLWKAVWPSKLAVIYPLQNQLPWVAVLTAVTFLVVITWLAWRMRRQHPYLPVGWLWFLGTLVPVIGLVQVGIQAMADRYTYVPLIGIFIAVAFGIRSLIARFQIGIVPPVVAASLILGSCLVLTEHQLSYWKNDEMLFGHAVAVTKNNEPAYLNLGVAFEKNGYQTEAMTNFQETLRINPRNIRAHNNLGNILSGTGKTNEALAQYQEAMELNPKEPTVHINLGTLLVQMGRFDEGMNQYEQAVQLNPNDSRPYYSMGNALLHQGRDVEAVDNFHKAAQLDPNDFQTLAFLARVLASDENSKIRNGTEAVVLAEKANDLTGGEHPFVLDTLAMSYAEVGRFQDAQQIEQRAIRIAQAAGLEETNAMIQRLELYKAGRPYRETFTNSPLQSLLEN